MKINTAASLLVAAVLAIAPAMSFAEDGAALYKSKCQMCHGDAGQGKMGPKLVGTTKTEADIVKILTKGGEPKAPHITGISGLSDDQAKSIAKFVKDMK